MGFYIRYAGSRINDSFIPFYGTKEVDHTIVKPDVL